MYALHQVICAAQAYRKPCDELLSRMFIVQIGPINLLLIWLRCHCLADERTMKMSNEKTRMLQLNLTIRSLLNNKP